MTWAMELSPPGFDEMLADLARMDKKTGRSYLQLLGYLRRFGSVPSSDRALASVLGVTVRFLHEVAWPLLQDRLVKSDDGQRYFDPDITATRTRSAAEAPASDHQKNQQQRDAANASWAKRRARQNASSDAKAHAESDAEAHAEGMRPHAETHVIPMRGASETHAKNDAAASSGASDASLPVRAPSLPLSDSSSSKPQLNQEELGRERADAGARGDAPGKADADADRMQSDAKPHAKPHAGASKSHGAERSRSVARSASIPADWRPSPAGEQEARRRGYDPGELSNGFRDHYQGNGQERVDWDATFLGWCRREAIFGGKRQGSLPPMGIPGGTASAPPRSDADKALDARLLALARRHAESKLGPDTPTREGFDAACRLGKPADGIRWITTLEDVWRAELIDAAELPTFQDYVSRPNRYADEMAEIDAACGSPQHRASG